MKPATLLPLLGVLAVGCAPPAVFRARPYLWKDAKKCLARELCMTPCVSLAIYAANHARTGDDRALATKLTVRALEVYRNVGCDKRPGGCISYREQLQGLLYLLPPGTQLGKNVETGLATMCNERHVKQCAAASYALERGIGVRVDRMRAMSFAVRGCLGRDKPSCTQMANLAKRSPSAVAVAGVARSRSACAGGRVSGCAVLRKLAEARAEAARAALPTIRQVCEAGNLRVCSIALTPLSFIHDDAWTRWAVTFLARRCLNGGPDRVSACWNAGNVGHYRRIDQLFRDRAQQIRFLEVGCQLPTKRSANGAGICAELSRRVAAGIGVRRDVARARALADRACKLHGSECRRRAAPKRRPWVAARYARRPAQPANRNQKIEVSETWVSGYAHNGRGWVGSSGLLVRYAHQGGVFLRGVVIAYRSSMRLKYRTITQTFRTNVAIAKLRHPEHMSTGGWYSTALPFTVQLETVHAGTLRRWRVYFAIKGIKR